MQDSELIQAFLTESQEMLDEAEPKLIEMQHAAEGTGVVDGEVINSIFRLFHSIKGSAGFLQMENVSHVTHEAETLLDLVRKGKVKVTADHVGLLCRACDVIRALLSTIEESSSDKGHETEVQEMAQELSKAITESKSVSNGAPPSVATPSAKNSEAMKADMIIFEDEVPMPMVEPAKPRSGEKEKTLITPEMVHVFVQDAEEVLDSAEQALLKLSSEPDSARENIAGALRAIHTFKGNCGFLNLTDMQDLSHRTETLLEYIREGQVSLSEASIKILLKIIDVFRRSVLSLSRGESPKIQGYLGFIDLLQEMMPIDQKAETAPVAPASEKDKESKEVKTEEKEATVVSQPTKETPVARAKESRPEEEKPAARPEAGPVSTSITKRDVRVNVDKLDLLNNLVGELVIAEAMVTHNVDLQNLRLDNFERAAHQLNLITTELQDIAMSIRMIPLEATLRKMIRLVHDLSIKAGKKVDLQLVGVETEVDRTVAELVSDPLVHMVRNSIDHGIEPPEERRKSGKPETGAIRIEAKHQSGEVWIVINDDGRGLNKEKILARALERGLINSGSAPRDDEIYNLIFEPGFSTAEKITDVSGRGVGMDVVKKNVEKMQGRVETHTVPGKGSTFIIRIPLTLAIIQGMLLRVGSERYIIPLLAIRESFRPTPQMVTTVINRGEMISIRGELLPMFRMARLFNVSNAVENPQEGIVVIAEDGNRRTAILVDELLGQQQVVVKSLGESFGQIQGISGASIMSDGKVGLILDVGGIVKMAIS